MAQEWLVERFVTNIGAAFSKRISDDTKRFYLEKLCRWDLTEVEWCKALSRIVGNLDRFPTLSQIYPYLQTAKVGTDGELEPLWELSDHDGKRYARKTGRLRSVTPSEADVRLWRAEAVRFAAGKIIFASTFAEVTGHLPAFTLDAILRPSQARGGGLLPAVEQGQSASVPGEL